MSVAETPTLAGYEWGTSATSRRVHLVEFDSDRAESIGSGNGPDKTLCSRSIDAKPCGPPTRQEDFCEVCESIANRTYREGPKPGGVASRREESSDV